MASKSMEKEFEKKRLKKKKIDNVESVGAKQQSRVAEPRKVTEEEARANAIKELRRGRGQKET